MHRVLVTHWLLVEALILPYRVVLSAGWRILSIVDCVFGVLASRPYVDLLDPTWGLFGGPLASIHQDERHEAHYEG
jgi:hypothetical protein